MAPSFQRGSSPTRRLITVGFGGLMVLIAFAGLIGISVVRAIESRNDRIRSDYVTRNRILQLLRSDIYLSGTYVRDLLLEPDPAIADSRRRELDRAQQRIYTNQAAYKRILLKDEQASFRQFDQELKEYLDSLAPALEWGVQERRKLGPDFISTSLLPRRMEAVRLADRLSELNEKQLDAGNRQVKQLFRRFQLSLVFILLLSLGCGAVLTSITIRRLLGLEASMQRHLHEVSQTRSELRELSARLVDVQESERRAIARELHDEIGQAVSGLLLGIGNVTAALRPQGSSEALELLQELRHLAEKTVSSVRDMSLLLRPSMLDDLGLVPALKWQARETSRTQSLAVEVVAGEMPEDLLTEEQKTCIYRIVQEALKNSVRHARADTVVIRFSVQGRNLFLEVDDDGRGFTPAEERGLGLLGMEERVTHLHGTFQLQSQPGRGTSIHVCLPIHSRDANG